MLSYSVEGLKEIGDALRALRDDFGPKVLTQATSAMCTPLIKAAQHNLEPAHIQMRTGTLVRAFYRMKIRALSSDVQCCYIVGIHQGKRYQKGNWLGVRQKGTGRDAYYWWWLEFGKKGRSGTPFLGPALANNRDVCVEIFRLKSREGIDKIAKQFGGSIK